MEEAGHPYCLNSKARTAPPSALSFPALKDGACRAPGQPRNPPIWRYLAQFLPQQVYLMHDQTQDLLTELR
jgi:hypothetical protein